MDGQRSRCRGSCCRPVLASRGAMMVTAFFDLSGIRAAVTAGVLLISKER